MAAVLMPLPVRTAQPTSEPTRFFPREGRTPPARLQLVPEPTEERTTIARESGGRVTWKDILRLRGELPAASKPARKPTKSPPAPVAPWNRKGFVYPEPTDSEGKRARELASCQEDMERIRSTPKNLAALLKTAEWKGARVVGTVGSPEIGQAERAVSEAASRVAESEREIASIRDRLADALVDGKVRQTLQHGLGVAETSRGMRLGSLSDARKRLDAARSEEWIRVVHPSGATITIRPSWGE